MILELDMGNTRIKWRLLGEAGLVVQFGCASNMGQLLLVLQKAGWRIRACRVCAVRSVFSRKAEYSSLLKTVVQGQVLFAESSASLAGVTNAYPEPKQLGIDRWLAMVAGYQRLSAACVVIDAGTALTVDYVQDDGKHLGGMIAPGVTLLARSLGAATGLPVGAQSFVTGPQTDTVGCLSAGVGHMLGGFLATMQDNAKSLLGDNVQFLLAGGDAGLVKTFFEGAQLVDDLVFTGLALACPIEE